MTSETLAQLLDSLPEEERIILTLYYVRSFTSAQIAEILHVPEKAVSGVIISGRTRLTARLKL